MLANVKIKAIDSIIDIESNEAFKILCDSLYMDFVYDEDIEYFVKKNSKDESGVYIIKNGHEQLYDDRGDLFIALRNVAVNMFPNMSFRNADYIYH